MVVMATMNASVFFIKSYFSFSLMYAQFSANEPVR